MVRTFGSPGRYIQGYGVLNNLENHIGRLGGTFYVIGSARRLEELKDKVSYSFHGKDARLFFEPFNGEVTAAEVDRLADMAKSIGIDVVIGLGGGKAIDCAKAVAHISGVDVVIIPTTAATDAPTSALSIIYDEQGRFEDVRTFQKSPAAVIMDTEVICKSPPRFVTAGIGDALSTYFEARACQTTYSGNYINNGLWTMASRAIAETCFEALMKYGRQAVLSAETGVCTEALERIIEANTLLSGIGFESNGIAIAHAIYDGFAALPPDMHKMYHGEYVGFGVLVQLILEAADKELIDSIYRFCMSVNLPVTFDDMEVPDISDEHLRAVADGALNGSGSCKNVPFPVDARLLIDAMKMADVFGKLYKTGGSIL